MYLIFDCLSLISCIGLIAACYDIIGIPNIILKTAASVFFVIAGICGLIRRSDARGQAAAMVTAFVLSAAGDIFLIVARGSDALFIAGVASFAAAHIMFLTVFCKKSPVKKADIGISAVIFAVLLAVLLLGDFEYNGLLPVIIGYTVIVTFMMVKALSVYRVREGRERAAYLIMAGGVLFLVSDFVLLFWLFGKDMPMWVQAVNLITYYTAQACLSASLNQKEF